MCELYFSKFPEMLAAQQISFLIQRLSGHGLDWAAALLARFREGLHTDIQLELACKDMGMMLSWHIPWPSGWISTSAARVTLPRAHRRKTAEQPEITATGTA